ncbi:MAG: polyphenol oxidase family protein [Planctomycetes bacterium]|nr:polyphenol oxidase family protein [Planctomycetota bacterium]
MLRRAHGLLRFALLEEAPGIAHAFVPAAALGGYDATVPGALQQAARLVLGEGARVAATRQTHSRVVALACASAPAAAAEVDGLISAEPGLLLHAVSSDCPLLYLAAADARAVGIAHCGWRGIAAGIVEEALCRLREDLAVDPAELSAAVSPGAGGCCYEVGREVIEALAGAGVPIERCVNPERRTVDLKQAIRALLLAAGVPAQRIELARECTICGGDGFHSFRKSGAGVGRMSGLIGIRPR